MLMLQQVDFSFNLIHGLTQYWLQHEDFGIWSEMILKKRDVTNILHFKDS